MGLIDARGGWDVHNGGLATGTRACGGSTRLIIRFAISLGECLGDHGNVTVDRMVLEMIDLYLAERLEKSEDAIAPPLAATQRIDPASMIQIDLDPIVSIAEPGGRDTRDDVVIVNETIMSKCNVIHVSLVTDSWAAERVKFGGIAFDVRKKAATGADGRHRATE